jgi:hypothetical protein
MAKDDDGSDSLGVFRDDGPGAFPGYLAGQVMEGVTGFIWPAHVRRGDA